MPRRNGTPSASARAQANSVLAAIASPGRAPAAGMRAGRAGRWSVVIAAAGLAGALLTACDGPSGPSITLYSGQHEQTTDALVAGFEKATGITVNVRNADEDTLANLIALQGSRSPADVFYTENSPALSYLQGKGLLAHVDPATLARVPARYSSPQRDWVGVSARVSVLIYNPSLISASQLPTSVLQLASPRYRGKLALAAGETDFQPIVTSVLRNCGKAATLRWLTGLKANAASHILPDNETLTEEVNRGLVAFGLINQYYWYRLRAQIGTAATHSKIVYLAPRDPGYVLDVSGAAVLRSSRHQAAAQRFLGYLVSRAGEEIIAHSDSFEYPLGSGVRTAARQTPFGQLRPDSITIGELGDGSTAIALLQQAGLL